jgi:hypothetical protein
VRTKERREQKPSAGALGAEPVLIGWMGVTLQAPAGWSPVSVSGEGENGYIKAVSPDTRYLEVKWERPKGMVSVPDALHRYFDKLRQGARKSRQELRIKERPRSLSGIRSPEQAPIAYSWEADRKAMGCIWHCGECGRLVIAEVVGEPDADLSPAAEILRSVREHGEDQPGGERWNTWALYGLNLCAPQRYTLEKNTLMTGHQQFLLRDRGAMLQADRWGLAEIALRGTSVREWYEGREAGFLMKYAYRVEETEIHGHPAWKLVGRNRIPFALLKILRMPATMAIPRFSFTGYLWQCPESNRIHAVMGEQPRRSTLVQEVAEKVCCHR